MLEDAALLSLPSQERYGMAYTSLKYSLAEVRAAGEDIRRSNPDWADPLELSENRQAEVFQERHGQNDE